MSDLHPVDADSSMDRLLTRVEKGEGLAVIRNGRHVATIVPAGEVPSSIQEVFSRNQERRARIISEGRGLSLKEIVSLRDEGRK